MLAVHECLRVGNPCFLGFFSNGLLNCCEVTDLAENDFSGFLFSANSTNSEEENNMDTSRCSC